MRTPTAATLFLIVFMDLVGFGIVLPLFQYAGPALGTSQFGVGLIIASFSLMQFIFSPWWGRLSDRVGRRPILLLSLATSTVSYVMFALATDWVWLLASRILAGIGAANVVVAQAYIADITPPEGRSKGMGLIGMAFGLGFILGPVIGGLAAGAGHGFALAGWIAAGLCGLNGVLAWAILGESLPAERRRGHGASDRETGDYFPGWGVVMRSGVLSSVAWGTLFTTISFTIWETTFGRWLAVSPAYGWDEWAYGLILGWVGLTSAMVQGGLIGRLVKRYGEVLLVKASIASMLVLIVGVPALSGAAALLLAMAAWGAASGANRPSLYGLASLHAPAGEQGAVMGLMQASSSLARIIGPPLGGWLFDVHRDAPFWAAGVSLAFALIAVWGLRLRLDARPGPEATGG